jgi:hypothetical protein
MTVLLVFEHEARALTRPFRLQSGESRALTRRMQSLLARADVAQRVKQRNRTMPPLRGLMLLRRVQAMEPPDVLSVSEPMPLVMVINNLRSLRAM